MPAVNPGEIWMTDFGMAHEFAPSRRRRIRYISTMSTVQEIQAAVPKLTPQEQAELKEWLENSFEDQLELTDEVKAKLDESRAEIAAGQYRTRQS